MKNYHINNKTKINLIELSDIFRRSAAKFDNEFLAKKLVKATKRIVVLSTYYMPEYPNLPENKLIDKKIKAELENILGLIKYTNINEIILPFEDHKDFWQANRIKNKIIDRLLTSSSIKIKLHIGQYDKDNSFFGAINKSVKTALDKGIRGMVSINDDLKSRWDNPNFKA